MSGKKAAAGKESKQRCEVEWGAWWRSRHLVTWEF